jgi:hypothetical protein
MPKFKAHVTICGTSKDQVAADLYAMSAAHKNKTVQVDWIKTREGN